jgi:16S rRNA (guanine966-N2)-methyltransferase
MTPRKTIPGKPANLSSEISDANRLRIIGGRWRGTRLNFPDVTAIRPTPDRVRETLFNWLQQDVVGAQCLDLFAGSGALGFEALSRGAQSVVFVDQEPQIARYLRDTLARLKCTAAEVHSGVAHTYLQRVGPMFDLVFLDPPFAVAASTDLLVRLFEQLETHGRLQAQAWIYLECPVSLGSPATWRHWPAHWRLHRSKQAGQVGYHLARRTTA